MSLITSASSCQVAATLQLQSLAWRSPSPSCIFVFSQQLSAGKVRTHRLPWPLLCTCSCQRDICMRLQAPWSSPTLLLIRVVLEPCCHQEELSYPVRATRVSASLITPVRTLASPSPLLTTPACIDMGLCVLKLC